jgi:hypothetical protein
MPLLMIVTSAPLLAVVIAPWPSHRHLNLEIQEELSDEVVLAAN